MKLTRLRKLTATHKTELFILALSGIFDISFGIEKLMAWKGHPVPSFWAGAFYLTLGLAVAAVGVFNLIRDVHTDCTEDCEDACCKE